MIRSLGMMSVLSVALSMFFAAVTFAQVRIEAGPSTKPVDSPEAAAVKSAAKAFVTAVFGEDFDAVSKAFGGAKEDLELMRTLQSAIKANRAAHSAIDAKFPPAPDDKNEHDKGPALEDAIKQIDSSDVNIDGDAAAIPHVFELQKADGKWRVSDVNKDDKPGIKKFVPAMLKSSSTVIAGLKQDKYASREDAERALNDLGGAMDGEAAVAEKSETATTTQPADGSMAPRNP